MQDVDLSFLIKELPIKQAKYNTGEISSKEFEEYLVSIIDYCGEITELKGDVVGMSVVKDYVWNCIDFLT